MSDKFDGLHEWVEKNEAAGTMFVPDDVEGMWQECFEEETGLTFEEVWPELVNSYEWRKGIQEVLVERGWEAIDFMLESYAAEKGLLKVQKEREKDDEDRD